ncbi:MAG: GspH/FimT family pseudopilin [Pseudomonadales bacterium]|nr:GspH/FimT family pseudopilin [Pseudomonadales bacterium]
MNKGLTVLELLVALVIAALLAGMAAQTWQGFIARERGLSTINSVAAAIATARSAAIQHRRTVRLCPGSGDRCAGRNQWHVGSLIFMDRNRNRSVDENETVISRTPGFKGGSLRWRSFRNRIDLVFSSSGVTDWLNGSFLYCDDSGNPAAARMLIVNVAGRVRHSRDSNGDGIREDAAGDPLRCT